VTECLGELMVLKSSDVTRCLGELVVLKGLQM